MPLLTRMPKHRVKAQVATLAPGFAAGALLRQGGIPVHDISLSRKRFSWGAFGELLNATREFRPDVIQAWGHTAQLVALLVRSRCDWPLKVMWTPAETAPLPTNAGLIDRQKLKLVAKFASRADGIVYTSEAAAMLHRRAGLPEGGHAVVPPGVDPIRFKPDFAARKKVREQLGLSAQTFVIGMAAPFQPGSDHTTLIKAVGELIKTNPNVALILAGHGVQKGNGPLMALVGGGTMGTRTQLLGDWSDMSAFYNACDIACSSSLNDSGRLTLVMAMLCGVPCVGTGMGAQGEVIGQFGVAVEPGSPAAFIRGITRVMQLQPDRRAFMAQGARKHALNNFVYVRSLQKYLQLYFDSVGRQALAAEDVPTPEIDAAIPAPPPDMQIVIKEKKARNAVAIQDLSDPDSIEAKVSE
ncbi:MAG TPA: glycosyltransferase, partial [Povalibacter sp.]